MKKIKIRTTKPSPTGSDSLEETGTDDVLFWINRSGFPISDNVWDRMFDHAAKVHPAGDSVVREIKNNKNFGPVPIPRAPSMNTVMSGDKRVEVVQQYMSDLQYNHTGTQFYDIKKYRPLSCQTDTAKEMIKESLPIKCLEAVILGIYLTNGTSGLERYPLSFRSVFGSNVHRHVVLVVSWNGIFGALGMSRREDLMYKPLQFACLSDLVIDFIESYNQYSHRVNKVKIGFPISHDPQSHEPIHWKGLAINPSKMKKAELKIAVEKHGKDIRAWVRQAPLGATYAPRTQGNSYPTPTFSQATPSRHKAPSSSFGESESVTVLDRASTSMSGKSTVKATPRSSSKPSYEMRI